VGDVPASPNIKKLCPALAALKHNSCSAVRRLSSGISTLPGRNSCQTHVQKSVPRLVKTNSLGLLGAFVSDWLISFSSCESEVTNEPHESPHGKVFSSHTPRAVERGRMFICRLHASCDLVFFKLWI